MKGVAVISKKGGVGKSTICHLLAVGSAWRNVASYIIHTDNREPMTTNDRPYAYIDGRDPERLASVMEQLLNHDGYCIIDGGGNRPKFDKWIAESVDLVLIPVTADAEAVALSIEMMRQMEDAGIHNARYLLNMVSSNRNSREYDRRTFFSMLEAEKIAGELKRVDAVKRLRISDVEPFKTPPYNVNNLSRSLHRIVDTAIEGLAETGA